MNKLILKSKGYMALGLIMMQSAALAQPGSTTDTIHPDLIVPEPAYSQETIDEINKQIEEMIKPVETKSDVLIPDYKFAYQKLQSHIAFAIAKYINTLTIIDGEVKKFLSDINALEQAESEFIRSLAPEEIIKRGPLLNTKINGLYKDAVRGLYLMDDLSLVVTIPSKKNAKNQLGEPTNYKNMNALRFCRTKACVRTLSKDIASYYAYIRAFNQEIDFTNFEKQKFLIGDNTTKSPLVTLSIARAAKNLMSGIKPNQEHTVGNTLRSIFKAPGGVIVGLAAAPVFIFEKIIRFAQKLTHLKTLKVELKLYAFEMFSDAVILEQLILETDRIAYDLPAVVFDAEESKKVSAEYAALLQKDMAELVQKYAAININIANETEAAQTSGQQE